MSLPRAVSRRVVSLVVALGIAAASLAVPLVAVAAQTGACPDFRQPYSGDPAYQKGDKVLFQGTAYVSTFAPTRW